MVVVEWEVRDYEDPIHEQEAYHSDLFSVMGLQEMLKTLGYPMKKNKMYYHFKIPNSNLDYGLQALGNDADVINLVRYIDKYRLIEVYIEHEYTILDTYLKSPQKLRLEEIVDVESSALARKPFKKPGLKVNRLPQLLLEGPSLNDEGSSLNAEFNECKEEDHNEDENGSDCNEEAAYEDETVSESDESDDSEDSDYIFDDDNVINEVEVDMQEFYKNINKDVEWVGPSKSKGKVEVPAKMNVEEGYDLDDFDMDIDCDKFVDKQQAISLVRSLAVASRRQLYVWKNDRVRVRAVCRGKCPEFTNGPDASGLNSPNRGKLKQVNGKWIKCQKVQTSCSGQGINNVGVKQIKVGGKKGNYLYDTITCPWSLQISKENNTWTCKTYKDEHTCLQTRQVKLLTDKWLSNQIEDIVKPNPEIPVKALKEQLQKKYQVGISIGKVKRARAASIMRAKGDFTQQYSYLRDYVLELQRTNEDTTVKIDLERDYNPNETTRQFKRIYVCIGALKRGFKEGLRELLGLDGCFMKGQYPGQLLTAVGIDANHGIYPLAYAIVVVNS
ncbi:hypothetical protein Tco_0571396 [Tanacetum coccineum]